ncbi:MAG TPA: low affinity iron permease family protein [Pirellulales bacterium]|jgi:low affinity Fe/Cu permease|nr:low affinity iron permease family protein [Pirellulales bacterium]
MATDAQTPRRTNRFTQFAKATATATGNPYTFIFALGVLAVWAITGPIFGYSDTWQLVINTGTSVVTFLMVFLIQNTQNRDSAAMHIKLDELIRITKGAHNALLDLEDLTDDEIHKVQAHYQALAKKAQTAVGRGRHDTDCPPLDPNCHETLAGKPAT